jgi:DNA-binding CsgD family transcriptional regulator
MSPVEHAELTDLERQVARLVAWGGSNSDVAEALGIDTKTVERHLERVYRKLGIRSGAELPRLSTEAPVEAVQPNGQSCFVVIEGPSPDAIGEASRRAALEYERIVERREQ